MPDKFYLTTPIYYVNARPHIGSAYTTLVADVLARRHRMMGDEVYFLTGTDEHGQKIERSAAAAGIPPQQFADQVSQTFSSLWTRLGITHNQFIRTSSPTHKQGVQQLFRTLWDNGKIYLSSYTGQYSVGEEMFVEGPPGTIGPDGKPTETVTEENFFFRLSDYQLPLLNLIESNQLLITPDSRRNEVLSFLRGPVTQSEVIPSEGASAPQSRDTRVLPVQAEQPGAPFTPEPHPGVSGSTSNVKLTSAGNPYVPGALRDLSISRSSFTWGIPVPQDIQQAAGAKEPHIIYVWLDALANYITALGYGSADDSLFQKFWPADLHLMGKEITRFHCVYWPAFLLAAGLPPPRQITAHGWLLFDDAKMSKSKGNIVRAETILDAFGPLCPPSPPLSFRGEADEPAFLTPDHPVPHLREAKVGIERSSTAPHTPVILSEAQSAQSKNPLDVSLAAVDRTFQPVDELSTPGGPTPRDRDLFAADILRYFLLREIPFGQDGSFTFEAMVTRYNADLANGYGNLVSRTLSMIEKYFHGEVPSPAKRIHVEFRGTGTIDGTAQATVTGFNNEANALRFDQALIHLWQMLIQFADWRITSGAPWKLAKSETTEDRANLQNILYDCAEAIRIITILLHPILPYATTRVWQQLGLDPTQLTSGNGEQTTLTWGGLQPGTRLGPLTPIFPRADKSLIQKMTDMENESSAPKPDLTAITANNDVTHPDTSDFPEAPIADEVAAPQSAVSPSPTPAKKPLSRLVDETSGHTALTNPSGFDPAAPPRTTAIQAASPGATVAGSAALTTERHGTPPHTEAHPSGIFAHQPSDSSPQIAIDDFAKIDLRVAEIVVAECIPKADKLLRLEVDLGPTFNPQRRQILSGIAEWYTPEELLGRRIVVITNLAPRKMRGLESHGMLLAASAPEVDGKPGKPALATFADSDDLPLGSRLK